MTSQCSNPWLWVRALTPLAIFSLIALSGEIPPELALIIGPILLFQTYRDFRRRSTLRRREDGVYVWIEWHGGEGRSLTDPTDDWDSEGDGDGGD